MGFAELSSEKLLFAVDGNREQCEIMLYMFTTLLLNWGTYAEEGTERF